ncbi:MAG: PhnD/SsuA/transferrin family substrate-binding protein [Thermodesulfobacteriota bacterium]|nr:PhnD/SsuA/transferrin family substrate-binding protein [Thermodesulfobacteriota bacterium]
MKNLILFKGKKVIFSFIAVFLVTSIALAEDSIIKIGVLAKRGPDRCIEKWSLTAEYLSSRIPMKKFVILPIDYDQIYSVVENSEVDFILTNPFFYVTLEKKYHADRIATLKNKVLDEISTTYGGVVFCKKQRKDIQHLIDLKGKSLMAVKETALGGWIMAWRELKEAGLDPFKDFDFLNFGNTHDAVVYAVRDEKVDAGTVSTGLLERMDAEGKICLNDFYVIHEHGGGDVHLPFLHSTREYPEWPMARLEHTSLEVAEKVAVALIKMPGDSAAAQAAMCAGWTIPLNYQPVHECLKELKIGPYKNFGKITLTDILKKYWFLIIINFATLGVLAWFLAAHIKLNQKIKAAHKKLEIEVNAKTVSEKALQKEQNFVENLFNTVQAVILVLDTKGRIVRFNKYFEELSGYMLSEVQGRDWFSTFLFKENHVQLKALFKKAIGDINTRGNINSIIKKDGGKCEIEWYDKTLKDDKKNITGLLCVGLDISERKKMESQLQQAQKMEAIGTLAGGIAHDFNNILFPVIGYTEMLLEDIPEESPFCSSLDAIYTSALRAQALVKQILTFSRQEKGELKLMKMQYIIKEALKLIRSTIPATIEIKQNIQTDCGVIKADPTQIHQIVMNLVTNAYHAMEDCTVGELKVSLKEVTIGEYDVVTPDMTPGVYACLTVADTGTGMDKALTEKIFDPFFTTKAKGKGTGMGLSVVHGIIYGMGGAVKVYSEPGKGSEFYVYLPVVESSFEKQDTRIKEPIQGGTERILLVDDEEVVIAMEKEMLERMGYQVTSCTSSIEALEAFRAAPDKFDLIITDLAMPNMPGDKLAVELTKIRPDIPILLCTGFSNTMSEEKAASLGITGFLFKPIVMNDFSQKIRKILGSVD